MKDFVYLTAFSEKYDSDIRKARIYKIPAGDLLKLDSLGTGKLVGRLNVGGTESGGFFCDLKVFRFRVRQAEVIKDRDRCRELLEQWNS